MKCIVDHKKDGSAVPKVEGYTIHRCRKRPNKTTKVWFLCVNWRDKSSSWESLASLKETNPVEIPEFAVSQGIDSEPAFSWWVPYTLKQRNRIISAVNNRYHKRTHKLGIQVPKSVAEAKHLDDANGDIFWQDAIANYQNYIQDLT